MTNRIWMITGANSGFGRALTEAAVAAGDLVVAAARRPGEIAPHPNVHPVALDVTDRSRIAGAVAEALLWHGRIDVLVNNAGRGLVGAAEETTDAELRDLMDLHFFGPAALTRAVLPHMRERGTGAIVQLSSMGGRMSFPGVGGYSASKFALEGWSEALHGEVAPFGIKVLIVEPGAFRTSFAGPSALLHSPRIAAYDPITGPLRTGLPATDGAQPGDPARAAAAILRALDAEHTPLRLALGNDAADNVLGAYARAQAEALAWEKVSRGTDFD